MITIKDYERVWQSSRVKDMSHPEGFHENRFISWWYARFESPDDLYYVYVLYLTIKHAFIPESFQGIDPVKFESIRNKAGIKIEDRE